jgi:16S rRNA (cytosine967-C5)-methyltransferase
MTAREAAFKILLKFEQSKQHLDVITDVLLKRVQLSAKERKFVSNLVSGVVRYRALFDWKITALYNGNYKKALDKFKVILRLGFYEIDYLDFIPPHATVNEYVNLAKKQLPKSFVSTINAVIRTYLREGKSLNPEKKFKYDDTKIALKYSFPEWLIKRWLGIWDVNFVSEMCKALNERPTFDIRVNEKKISISDFENKLINENMSFRQSSYFKNVFKTSDIQKIRQLNLFKDGFCSVQDESGIIVTELLGPVQKGDRILDACVAPGSKYTAMFEMYSDQDEIYGLEINNDRIKIVKDNCSRLGFPSCYLVSGDAVNPPFKEQFDHILIDAPCSGLGTIQKHPDIKWRRKFDEILDFQKLQIEILNNISKHLKPGGYLIYSTCTIDPSENEVVIDKFLKRQAGKFTLITPPEKFKHLTTEKNHIRTFPHLHEMEGAFVAKLQRIS